jgi:hypothetical protein
MKVQVEVFWLVTPCRVASTQKMEAARRHNPEDLDL